MVLMEEKAQEMKKVSGKNRMQKEKDDVQRGEEEIHKKLYFRLWETEGVGERLKVCYD